MLPPNSPQAQSIQNQFLLTLLVAAGVFLLVTLLVLFASWRYRWRGDSDEPRQVYGIRKLEIGWTVAPALLLLVLFGLTLYTMRTVDPPKPGDAQPDLQIIAHQWWWEVHYPKSGAVTANEIHIPTGQQLLTEVESADVIHDFWVPQLARKVDATPGYPTSIWLQADKPGTYLGTCAEFCGAQHAWMRIRVVAQSPSDFQAWEQQQLAQPAAPSSDLAAQGAQIFQQRTCTNCHAIAGTGATQQIGPDLTHLGDRETLGAGVLDNTPEELARWLKDPQAIKPGSYMPNLKLSDSEINALVAYLEATP
ncbi:MAG: cytochrome c oxidase subunit II [Anaerolineae bacterium]